ncbi:SAM-dependent DNA methyltransferase [Candidatus Pacearchaeota archaeon]|nr:SAM-dependent DNA methyltransferase [Candidatus Pacearchaeota archaeon]
MVGLEQELKSKVRKLWDKFWSGGISNPLQAIEQISYLIYMKKLEDKDSLEEQNAILKGIKFKSIFEGHENCRWSVWSQYSSDKILDHVRDVVFKFMRELGDKDTLYSEYMKDASFSLPTASLLIESVNIINDMHIKEQNQDAQGDIYEYLLSELSTAGKNGQFRTPRHIIQMMTELANPEYGDRIMDPACGTAGFLVSAYEHILKANRKDGISTLTPAKKKILDEDTFYGYDIDRTMVRIGLMNLMMHGITNPKISRTDTLSKRYNENGTYDVILANPPFKGSIDVSEQSDEFTIKTKKTELLFLELMYNSLANGGRCAVIIPDGVLFGNSNAHQGIRKMLLEECRLDAVISMPSGVFKPYAGVSTAVLYFTKGEPTEKVWFYDMQADGFSLDDKRTSIEANDIPDILESFKKRRNEDNTNRKNRHFFVPIEEIKNNNWDLSLSKYKEHIYAEEIYREPEIILKEIGKVHLEIGRDIEVLKKLVE